jgi:signal transduction histidine kinase
VGITVVTAILILILARRKNRIKWQMQQEVQQKQQLLAIVMAQEQTQQKIARDLHDSLVQILGAAKIKLESGKPSTDSKSIAEAVEIIDKACVDARNIAHQLLPYSLEKHGLVIALQELIEKQPKRDGEAFQFSHATEANRFSQNVEINMYRIVQELIHNSIKHSGANEMKVHLSQKNGTMKLSVNDNGRGFNPVTVPRGAGLMNIESRLNSIHGTMRIISAENEGTTTVIELAL